MLGNLMLFEQGFTAGLTVSTLGSLNFRTLWDSAGGHQGMLGFQEYAEQPKPSSIVGLKL